MNPELFEILNASVSAKMIFGSNPMRVYPWGKAPQNVTRPYAVYGVFNGLPQNYLDCVPDIDNKGTQVDIYADDPDEAEQAAIVVRSVLEPHAHMISYSTINQDDETELYGFRLEFDFWETR